MTQACTVVRLPAGRHPGAAAAQDDVLRDHLHHLVLLGHTGTSVYARKRAITRLAAALPVPLLEATAADLMAWRNSLEPMTRTTIRGYVSHARRFYAWAADAALIPASPAARLPMPRKPRRLPRPISEDDLAAALDTAPPRVRPWLVLAGWAGLRACEIAWLQRDCILDNARPPMLLIAENATKGCDERIVPMSAFVLAELRACGLPMSGFVFPRSDGRPGPNSPAVISHVANRHLRGCGIAATLHQLRHRFGTMTYRACQDLRAVQELLGHKDPDTTAGYAAYDPAVAVAAVAALPVVQSRPGSSLAAQLRTPAADADALLLKTIDVLARAMLGDDWSAGDTGQRIWSAAQNDPRAAWVHS